MQLLFIQVCCQAMGNKPNPASGNDQLSEIPVCFSFLLFIPELPRNIYYISILILHSSSFQRYGAIRGIFPLGISSAGGRSVTALSGKGTIPIFLILVRCERWPRAHTKPLVELNWHHPYTWNLTKRSRNLMHWRRTFFANRAWIELLNNAGEVPLLMASEPGTQHTSMMGRIIGPRIWHVLQLETGDTRRTAWGLYNLN
jgi:hypothetical protein